MRSRALVDAMLLLTVLLWATTVISTRYSVAHGFPPIAFSALRQVGSAALLAPLCLWRERSLRLAVGSVRLTVLAIGLGYLNQLAFVYAVRFGSASTVGLMLGTVPILTALIAAVLRLEPLSRRLGVAAAVSFAGVALVSAGVGGIEGSIASVALGFLAALTWAGYSIAVATLTLRSSPLRVSAVMMVGFTPLLLVTGAQQIVGARYGALPWLAWVCVGGIALGTATSTLTWFVGLERVGPSVASLYANLQPFFVVVLGVLLLSERLSDWTIGGGAAIGCGLVLAWRARSAGRTPAADAVTVGVARST